MPVTIDLDDRGLATLGIADPDGEVHDYRFRLAPNGLSLWALELTRADTGAEYRVSEDSPGRWKCTCPAFLYRKRGAPECKHVLCAKAFQGWHKDFLEAAHVHECH